MSGRVEIDFVDEFYRPGLVSPPDAGREHLIGGVSVCVAVLACIAFLILRVW